MSAAFCCFSLSSSLSIKYNFIFERSVGPSFPFPSISPFLMVSSGLSGFGCSPPIQLTLAITVPLFPTLSTNSKVKSPFSVNVYVLLPLLFVTTISSLSFVRVAVTGSLV